MHMHVCYNQYFIPENQHIFLQELMTGTLYQSMERLPELQDCVDKLLIPGKNS